MATKDYYEILGVGRNADEKEIKAAFRKLSLQYHPDRHSGKSESERKEAEEKFKEIAEAYSVLSDKDKRKHYDTYGTMDGSDSRFDMDDIFEHFRRNTGFGSFWGNDMSFNNAEPVRKGKTIKVNVSVTLRDIYNRNDIQFTYERNEPCDKCGGSGVTKDGHIEKCRMCGGSGVSFKTYRNGYTIVRQSVACPTCNGTGETIVNPCSSCHGTGLKRKSVTLKNKIPYNCMDGSYVVVKNVGHSCERNNGEPGDLVIVFNVQDDPDFEMDKSMNLVTIKEVSVIDCIMGAEQLIRGIDGKDYKFGMNMGTTDGNVYVIHGKGMPRADGGHGDLLVYIKQKMPTKLSKDETELLNKLRKSKNFV